MGGGRNYNRMAHRIPARRVAVCRRCDRKFGDADTCRTVRSCIRASIDGSPARHDEGPTSHGPVCVSMRDRSAPQSGAGRWRRAVSAVQSWQTWDVVRRIDPRNSSWHCLAPSLEIWRFSPCTRRPARGVSGPFSSSRVIWDRRYSTTSVLTLLERWVGGGRQGSIGPAFSSLGMNASRRAASWVDTALTANGVRGMLRVHALYAGVVHRAGCVAALQTTLFCRMLGVENSALTNYINRKRSIWVDPPGPQ